MASARVNEPKDGYFFVNLIFSVLFPKSIAKKITTINLHLRSRIRLVFFLTCLVIYLVLSPNPYKIGEFLAYHSGSLSSNYKATEVTVCKNSVVGKKYETRLKRLQLSFPSWTQNGTDQNPIYNLRLHEAVLIMSKYNRAATLLDVGANIGKVTMPVLAMGQSHSVIAVEPVGLNMETLCRTAELNGWLRTPGLTLLKAAMSDQRGEMNIFVPDGREDNAALSAQAAIANVHGTEHGEKVNILVADQLIKDGGFKPDLIKIDTQGHELHVLKGLKEYLRNAPPRKVLVMAESDPKLMSISGVNPKDIYQLMMSELGYSPHCRPEIDYKDGELVVKGNVIPKETYPPGGCRDIFYFKHN